MKVMGSSVLALEVIVLGLVIPVAHVVYNYSLSQVVWTALTLIVLCILAIGAMRGDRRRAVMIGSLVQLLVLVAGLWITPFLVPAVLFGAIWILAISLSAKVESAQQAQSSEPTSESPDV